MTQEQVTALYENWQKALTDNANNDSRLRTLGIVLDNDTERWSTTQLSWNGETASRQYWQEVYDAMQGDKNWWIANIPLLESAYRAAVSSKQAADAAALAAQQQQAAAALAAQQQQFAADNPLVFQQLETQKIEAEAKLAEKAASVQGTTKYLIYGAIALVLVIGAIFFFRSTFKS